MYRLINARPSPYGRKVAIAMREKAIPYEVTYDVPWADGTCTPQFNPLEQLPILILDSGETVYESTYILEWLERRHPSPALLPPDNDGVLAVKKLQVLAEGIMDAARNLVFEVQRPDPSDAWVSRQRRKIAGGTAEIARLIGGRCYAVADTLTYADIAVGTTLSMYEFMRAQAVMPDLEEMHWRERYSNLSPYVDRLEERPSFRETRPVMFEVNLADAVS